jgi:hypothetical protein
MKATAIVLGRLWKLSPDDSPLTPVYSRILFLAARLLIGAQVANMAQAQVAYSTAGSTFTQNFDTLSGTAWTNNSTLTGWYLQRGTTNGTALVNISTLTTYDGSAAPSNSVAGNYGTTSASDRALGLGPQNTADSGNIRAVVLRFTNNTGSTLTDFSLAGNMEQWRNAGGTGFDVTVGYRLAGSATDFVTGAGGGTWLGLGALGTPVTGGTAGALDGNLSGNQSAFSYSVAGLSWTAGTDLFVRWSYPTVNNTNRLHGFAIDNVTFSATSAIPEPSSYAALAGLGALGLAWLRRRARAVR